jgi:pimeloyl-ACP methyl ester carboxylesterase
VPPYQDLVNALSLLLTQTGPSVLVGQSIGPAVARKLTWRHPETILAVAASPRAFERYFASLVLYGPPARNALVSTVLVKFGTVDHFW